MGLSKGDLIRWVDDYDMYAASEDEIQPIHPIYAYGIIIEVSKNDPKNVVVCRLESNGPNLVLHMIHDGFELVSSSKTTNSS